MGSDSVSLVQEFVLEGSITLCVNPKAQKRAELKRSISLAPTKKTVQTSRSFLPE